MTFSHRATVAGASRSRRFLAVIATLAISAGLAACSNSSNAATVPTSESTTTTSDAPFSARFEVTDTDLVAGEDGSGSIVLTNRSGAPIVSSACTSYTPELRRNGRGQDLPALTCLGHREIAVGETRIPITFSTLDPMCSSSSNRGLGPCLPDGRTPKLEPGDDELIAWSMDRSLPLPAPITIHVTA